MSNATAFRTLARSDIAPVNHDITDKRTLKYAPVSVLVGSEFKSGSSIQFKFTNTNSWVDMSDSYINVKLKLSRVVHTPVAGAVLVAFNTHGPLAGGDVGLNFNPIACIFSKASYEMQDKVVSNVNHVAQSESFIYRSQTSKAYRDTLGSSQWIDNEDARITRSQSAEIHEACWIPISLTPFSSNNQLLPPGITHSIKLDIASSWENKIIFSKTNTNKVFGPSMTAHGLDYYVEIQDIQLHVVHYTGASAPSGDIYFDYRNIVASYKNLNSQANQIHSLTIPPNVYRASLAFQRNGIIATTNNITKFKSNNAIEKKLKSFLLHIGAKNFPNVAPIIENSATSQIGLAKLWKDTQSALNHTYSSTGYESYSDWKDSPFYTLSLPRDATDLASDLDMDLTLDATNPAHLTESVVWLFCETTSVVGIRYSHGIPEVMMTESGNVVA